MEKKKVLILHGQPGMGHLMPARAIMEAFAKKYPEVVVKDADAFIFFYGILRYGYTPIYNFIVFKIPILFKMLYDSYEFKPIKIFLDQFTLFFTKKAKFAKFIKDFSPDFIIATNPVPLQLLSLTKQKNLINIPSANVCTDFGFHSAWYDQNINYYFVANDLIKKSLVEGHGVDAEKIMTTGIPTALKFIQPINRNKILADLNFNPSNPVLLIVGGQMSYDNLLKIVLGIKNNDSRAQFIIVAGRDKILQKKLENSELKRYPNIKIFNLVSNLQDYMSVADLVLSKAGGSTVAECLIMGLPMILSKHIPGQEKDNVDYVINNGAGIRAVSAEKIIETIVSVFKQPEKIAEMKENCKKIAKPNAASDLIDFVARII